MGSVVVGGVRFAGVPIAHGYYEGDIVLSSAGEISIPRFDLAGDNYLVQGAYAGTGGNLVLNLDRAVSDAERARLVLHVCGESYAFADAAHDADTHPTPGPAPDSDWSPVTQRMLHLSTTRSLPSGLPGISGRRGSARR